MVEEAAGHHHAALHVDDRIEPLADALVDAVDAQLELRLAAIDQGEALHAVARAAGGADAVFQPAAILVERGEHLPVIELDRIEIAVRDGAQPFARAALLGRQYFVEGGIVRHVLGVAERCGQGGLAVDDAFDLVDLSALHMHAHGEDRGLPVLAHRTEPGGVAGERVGHFEAGLVDIGDAAPQPLAHRQDHVVLGEHRVFRQRRGGRIACAQGIDIAAHRADQAGTVATDVSHRARLARRLGPHRRQWRNGRQSRRE